METNRTLEIIRNEIERRKNYISVTHFAEELLSFLSTLESEKPMNQDGLEDEYKDYVENDPVYSKLVNRNAGLGIARHFYELGCRRTAEKYDEIEYNRQREEGRVLPGFEDGPKGLPGKDFVPVEWVETLEMYGKWKIVKLEEDGSSEIPKDLDEAANNYLDVVYGKMPHSDLHIAIFIAGAKWDREQMMKEAIEAIISQCPGSNEIIFHNPNSVHSWEFPWKFSAKGLNKGDKVRIIIVKDDEKRNKED